MGDIMCGNDISLKNGDINIIYDDNEIIQSVIHNIWTVYGENPFHTNMGNKVYSRRIKVSNSYISIIADDCKNTILQDNRISKVISLTVTPLSDNMCEIAFVIDCNNNVISSNVNIGW